MRIGCAARSLALADRPEFPRLPLGNSAGRGVREEGGLGAQIVKNLVGYRLHLNGKGIIIELKRYVGRAAVRRRVR